MADQREEGDMIDPHIEPLAVEKRFEGERVRIFLAVSEVTKEYSLHVKLNGEHGFDESETLERILELHDCADCRINGGGPCHWKALGRKETLDAAAVIDASFDRFRKNLEHVLEVVYDCRWALHQLGYSDPFEFPSD
jgi:hypothetical protein